MVSYALFIPMLSVLVGLVWRKPWRQPYTCEMLSDVNSSSIKVIVPQGQIPASKPICTVHMYAKQKHPRCKKKRGQVGSTS